MNPWVLGAATASAAAVVLWWTPGGLLLVLRLGRLMPRARTPWRDRLTTPGWPAALGLAMAPWLVGSLTAAILLAVGVGVGSFALVLVRRMRRRAAADDLARRVAGGIELLAAELRTGITPAAALRGATEDLTELALVVDVAERGGDVPAALRALAAHPGAAQLEHVAAAWQVAERSGAPVADVLDRVVEAVRLDRDLARDVRAECASARATARMLAVLPVLGLGLGSGLGGDPVQVLTGTVPGAVCLALGCVLAAGGLLWVDRLATRAERVS